MHAQKLLKKLAPCIAALPKNPQDDTKGQAWLRSTVALLQSDSSIEFEQVQDLLNEGLYAVRNIPDLSFPKPERSYIGMIPSAECEIVSIDEVEVEEEMVSSAQAILLAKVV
jgi:hypothetical protein